MGRDDRGGASLTPATRQRHRRAHQRQGQRVRQQRFRLKLALRRLAHQRMLTPPPPRTADAARLRHLARRRCWRRDHHREWLWQREGLHWSWTRIAAHSGAKWTTVRDAVRALQRELTRWGEVHD